MATEKVVPIKKSRGCEEDMSKKSIMLTDQDKIIIREVPIGKVLKGKEFDSFETLRRRTNKIIGQMRNDWLSFVLMKNSIYINYSELTKREIIEIYERNGISIVNDNGVDRVFKLGQLLGEWSRERKLYFNNEGQLMLEIKYSVI